MKQMTANDIVNQAVQQFNVIPACDLSINSATSCLTAQQIKATSYRCIWGAIFEVVYAISKNPNLETYAFPDGETVRKVCEELRLELGFARAWVDDQDSKGILDAMTANDNSKPDLAQNLAKVTLDRIMEGKTLTVDDDEGESLPIAA
ncbi:MAG: hypothetical protein GTO00_09265 [Deltaproteobacteria bacterium]|nr:hypothetical protein [Deltaproteobacteria bacterium]